MALEQFGHQCVDLKGLDGPLDPAARELGQGSVGEPEDAVGPQGGPPARDARDARHADLLSIRDRLVI
jgi:hypothetical protein